MTSFRRTIARSAAVSCFAVAVQGCLLVYDFEEYATSGGGGSGGGDVDFSNCTDGEVTYTVLPAAWTGVRVVQVATGFVAAPRDVDELVRLKDPTDASTRLRASGFVPEERNSTSDLRGLLRLNVENVDRVVGVRADSSGLKLKALDPGFGEGSDPIPGATFRNLNQGEGLPATLLVSKSVINNGVPGTLAQALVPSWDAVGDRPATQRTLVAWLDDIEEPSCREGTCEFRAAVAFDGGTFFSAAYLGQGLTPEATVGETLVGEGPFFALLSGEGSVVVPLGSALDEFFDLSPDGGVLAGASQGKNAIATFLDEEERFLTQTLGEGAVDSAYPSRFAKDHLMVTQFVDDAPEVVVLGLGETAVPVLTLPNMTGFDVATAPRTSGDGVGLLVSAVVQPGADVVVGECRLPAGRSILAEREVARP